MPLIHKQYGYTDQFLQWCFLPAQVAVQFGNALRKSNAANSKRKNKKNTALRFIFM